MKTPVAVIVVLFVMMSIAVFAVPPNQGVGTGNSFKGPVGLQLYSLRDEFAKDVPGTLATVKGFGIQIVELAGTYNLAPAKLREQLAAHGLKAVAGHFPYERFKAEPAAIAAEAKALGLQYAGCAWIAHEGAFDEKECRDAIATFNKAGEVLAKQGVRFFYHTHGYEFEPFGTGTLFDLLMKETDPNRVTYEMDILWIHFPGQSPAKILEAYPKRFELMHIKDLKKGVKGNMSGGTDVTNDVVLGTGQIDLRGVLKAARKAGVKYYFIEDESPQAASQIPKSLKFLEQLVF
jgi:sugar phosphate isomerase/epimerase